MKLFDVNFSLDTNWENTSYIQEAIWNVIQCSMHDESMADNVSMVSAELVENAIKYGDADANNQVMIDFSLKGDHQQIVIGVINQIKSDSKKQIAELDETIQWVRGFQNPFEAYVEKLKMASRARDGSSKLGLARIAYEGRAIVDFYIDNDEKLSVSATIPLR